LNGQLQNRLYAVGTASVAYGRGRLTAAVSAGTTVPTDELDTASSIAGGLTYIYGFSDWLGGVLGASVTRQQFTDTTLGIPQRISGVAWVLYAGLVASTPGIEF
jgi:hypothetical protein